MLFAIVKVQGRYGTSLYPPEVQNELYSLPPKDWIFFGMFQRVILICLPKSGGYYSLSSAVGTGDGEMSLCLRELC